MRSGGLLGIDHVQLTVPPGEEHLDAARACYVDVLGFSEIEKPEPLRARGGLWFEGGVGAARFQVHLGVETPSDTRRHPGFVTDDLDTLRSRVEAAGLRVVDDVPLHDRRRFFAYDPFGNRIEFLQRRVLAGDERLVANVPAEPAPAAAQAADPGAPAASPDVDEGTASIAVWVLLGVVVAALAFGGGLLVGRRYFLW